MYSLISGVGIFFLGAGVTVYHGVAGLINPAPLENLVMVRCNKKHCLPRLGKIAEW